jgi:hypothetical protein
MGTRETNERTEWVIRALLLGRRHLRLALWMWGTLLYGALAGALLHEHPAIAGAVLATVWLGGIWRSARFA